MKLRNKKTGKIIEYSISLNQWSEDDQEWYLFGNYDSIDELKEEWEDYKPAGPLVEGKSQRAVLRAAARLSGTNVVTVQRSDIAGIVIFDFGGQCRVELKDRGINVKNRGVYAIAELCGSEEIEILEPTFTTIEEKAKLKETE